MVTPRQQGLDLTWNWDTCITCRGWKPSYVSLSVCFVASLDGNNTTVGDDEECLEMESGRNPDSILIDNLRSFSEYKIKVDAKLEFFNVSSSALVVGRTRKSDFIGGYI